MSVESIRFPGVPPKLIKDVIREGTSLSVDNLRIVGNSTREGRHYVLKHKEEVLAKWDISKLKGCREIGVSHAVSITEKYRGIGLGKALHALRLAVYYERGLKALICTSVEDNSPQSAILLKGGWTNVGQFYNPRTSNQVKVWFKSLGIVPDAVINRTHTRPEKRYQPKSAWQRFKLRVSQWLLRDIMFR